VSGRVFPEISTRASGSRAQRANPGGVSDTACEAPTDAVVAVRRCRRQLLAPPLASRLTPQFFLALRCELVSQEGVHGGLSSLNVRAVVRRGRPPGSAA
jgi:hypothetical protein